MSSGILCRIFHCSTCKISLSNISYVRGPNSGTAPVTAVTGFAGSQALNTVAVSASAVGLCGCAALIGVSWQPPDLLYMGLSQHGEDLCMILHGHSNMGEQGEQDDQSRAIFAMGILQLRLKFKFPPWLTFNFQHHPELCRWMTSELLVIFGLEIILGVSSFVCT